MYVDATAPQARVLRGTLPSGHAGTRVTLELMRDLARQGARSPDIRELALRVLHGAGVRPHDTLGEVAALFQFVRDGVRFTNDPVGVEVLQHPRETLRLRSGDCDDRAILLAALLLAVGVCADLRFRVVAVDPRRPREFSHVYLVARVQGSDIPLDPTYSDSVPGTEPPSTLRGELPLCT